MSQASMELKSSAWRTACVIAADIKLAHSVFAAPFAILAAVMAATGSNAGADAFLPRFLGQLALVMPAMFFGRTVAMLSNRLLDRDIDRANPRTANRALPSGRASVTGAAMTLAAA